MQNTAYEMRISDWRSDVCSSDLATFGAGGYTRALLDCGATVHAFDRDPNAISEGRGWAEARLTPPRLVLHPRRFSEMVEALAEVGIAKVDGIAMDIGVSSMQPDPRSEERRGGKEGVSTCRTRW